MSQRTLPSLNCVPRHDIVPPVLLQELCLRCCASCPIYMCSIWVTTNSQVQRIFLKVHDVFDLFLFSLSVFKCDEIRTCVNKKFYHWVYDDFSFQATLILNPFFKISIDGRCVLCNMRCVVWCLVFAVQVSCLGKSASWQLCGASTSGLTIFQVRTNF